MLATVSGDLDARDPFLRRNELVRIPQIKLLPFIPGELVGVVPEVPLDGRGFLKRFVVLADAKMLVSLAFVVVGEDREMVRRPAFRRICFFAQVLAHHVAPVGCPRASYMRRHRSGMAVGSLLGLNLLLPTTLPYIQLVARIARLWRIR